MTRIITLTFICLTTLKCFSQGGETVARKNIDTLTLLTAGLPGKDFYQYHKLAPKYHFELIWLGGCTVEQEILDSIYKHNLVVDSLLDLINGKNWREKYEFDVRQTFKRDSILINKLKRQKFIKRQLTIQKRQGNGLQYFVDSALTEDIFRIRVLGSLNDKYSNRGSYYRVIMRYPDLKILSVDDRLIKTSKPVIKTISLPVAQPNDTSLWYQHTQKIINQLDYSDLKLTKEYFHLRIWTEKQFVDISYNFRSYAFARLTNFTTSKKTGKLLSSNDIIFTRKDDTILALVDSLGLLKFPSDKSIQCWGRRNGDPATRGCTDGITYSIEFSTDTTYSFKSYSCPESWDCSEAIKVTYFFKRLDEILKLEDSFNAFIETLPNGCYENGRINLRCKNKRHTR